MNLKLIKLKVLYLNLPLYLTLVQYLSTGITAQYFNLTLYIGITNLLNLKILNRKHRY